MVIRLFNTYINNYKNLLNTYIASDHRQNCPIYNAINYQTVCEPTYVQTQLL